MSRIGIATRPSEADLSGNGPPQVLLVDDYVGTIDAFSTTLRNAGFLSASAATGREGIHLALSNRFDVALVDLRLPDMSGVDVVRELRLRGILTPLVIVTAFPTLESSFDASSAGANGYVDGPLFGDELVDIVEQSLHGSFPVRHPSRRHINREQRPFQSAIDGRVRETMRLIDSDLAKPWSVGEVASMVGLSDSRLRYLFSTCIGQSVTSYIRERRLQFVIRQLTSSTDNVQQIANRAGFKSMSLRDFRRAFQKRFGVAPTMYRSKHWRGDTSSRHRPVS